MRGPILREGYSPTKVMTESWFKASKATYSKHATALGAALSTIRRTAEAAALRYLLTEQMKNNDTPVIVLGDINDGQHNNTANILTEQPQYLVGDSVGGGDVALYTAQTLQEYRDTRDVYYTYVHQDIRESKLSGFSFVIRIPAIKKPRISGVRLLTNPVFFRRRGFVFADFVQAC